METPALADPAAAPSAPASVLRRRALAALLLIVPAPTLGVLAAMMWWPGTTAGSIVFAAGKAWMVLLPIFWRLVVDRQPLSFSPARHGGFGVGALLGLAISAVIWGGYAFVAKSWIDAEAVRTAAVEHGIGTRPRFLGMVAYWVLINAVVEEYVYRWFIFRKCEALMPTRLAVLASAGCFTIHHVFALKEQFDWNVTLVASLGIFVGGAIWSWLYGRYRSVWPAYLSHAIVDVAIFVIGWRLIFGGATGLPTP